MKKKGLALLLVVLMLMMPMTALADDALPVGVQINGTDMYFAESMDDTWADLFRYVSDKPVIIKEDRSYLPVDTLRQIFGVEKIDALQTMLQDVSFVEKDALYMPVALVADTLGVEVGWDSVNRTVILLDKDYYREQLSGMFTLMERYAKENALDFGSTVKTEGTLHFALDMTTYDNETGAPAQTLPVTVTVDTSALSSGTKANLDAAVEMDVEALLAAIAQAEDSDMGLAMLLPYFEQFHVAYRMDLETGALYLKSELFLLLGGDADTWYSIYLEDIMEDAEYDAYLKLLQQGAYAEQAADIEAVILSMIDEIPMDDIYAVPNNLQALEILYDLFGDDNFEKTKDGYINDQWDDTFYFKVALTEQANTINGIELVFASRDVAEEALGGSILAQLKQQDTVYTLKFRLRLDSELGEYLRMQADGKWVYHQTGDIPLTAPQDGEMTADLVEMLEGAA